MPFPSSIRTLRTVLGLGSLSNSGHWFDMRHLRVEVELEEDGQVVRGVSLVRQAAAREQAGRTRFRQNTQVFLGKHVQSLRTQNHLIDHVPEHFMNVTAVEIVSARRGLFPSLITGPHRVAKE